jgi:hypothetical protein
MLNEMMSLNVKLNPEESKKRIVLSGPKQTVNLLLDSEA